MAAAYKREFRCQVAEIRALLSALVPRVDTKKNRLIVTQFADTFLPLLESAPPPPPQAAAAAEKKPTKKRTRTYSSSEDDSDSETESSESVSPPPAVKLDPFLLEPHQREHAEAVKQGLRTEGCHADLSGLGQGKTPVSVVIASEMYDCMLVVGLPGMRVKYTEHAARQGVPMLGYVTWNSLAGTKRHACNHPWLKRVETPETYLVPAKGEEPAHEKTRIILSFEPTAELHSVLATKKVMVVLDEVHKVKNPGPRIKAVARLAHTLKPPAGSPHRHGILFASGSLSDKAEQFENFLRILGFLPPDTAEPLWASKATDYGLRPVLTDRVHAMCHERCAAYDPLQAERIRVRFLGMHTEGLKSARTGKAMSTSERFRMYLYTLWLEILKPRFSSQMKYVANRAWTKVVRNRFYAFQLESELERYNKAVAALTAAQAMLAQEGQARKHAFGALGAVMPEVEYSKAWLFVRAIVDQLHSDPKSKVMVAVNYIQTVDLLCTALEQYKPMRMTGDKKNRMSTHDRHQVSVKFKAHDYDEKGELQNRLIIGTMPILAEGGDYDDETGEHEVVLFGSPSYNAQPMQQFAGRSSRHKTKGRTRVYWVWGRSTMGEFKEHDTDDFLERKVILSLMKKAGVMKDCADEQVAAGELFFADLPNEVQAKSMDFTTWRTTAGLPVDTVNYDEGGDEIEADEPAAAASSPRPRKKQRQTTLQLVKKVAAAAASSSDVISIADSDEEEDKRMQS